MITYKPKPGSALQTVSTRDFLFPYKMFPLSDIIQALMHAPPSASNTFVLP